MSITDSMGDRLKGYEARETERKVMPLCPIYARIDGRGFSKFTRGMGRPYDEQMSEAMIEVTRYLVHETGATTGYTQSDEISLCWPGDGEVFFSGKLQKMVSTLAALATAKFIELALQYWPDRCKNRLPTFDARVFSVPNDVELANCFLWRVQDAIKNSVQMSAQHVCPHRELQGLDRKAQLIKLEERGIVWGEYPSFFKEGVFVKRREYKKVIPDVGYVVRTHIMPVDMKGPFKDVLDKAEFLLAKRG